MDDPTPKEEKNRRFDRLCDTQNRISLEIHQGYVGRTLRVLVDGREKEMLTARTEGGRLVRFAGDDSLIGQFLDVTITGCTTWSLVGEVKYKAPLSGELSAKLTERLQQIYSFPLSPTAPSFPPCRKRRGRKGTLGRVWCILPLILGRNQYFRRRSTRHSPYGYHTTRRLIRYTGFDGRCL